MFIRTRQEEDIVSEQTLKTSPDVTDGRRVDVADMGPVVDVVNGRRDVSEIRCHRVE